MAKLSEYLVRRSIRIPNTSAVYFLLDEQEEVVYVGKSKNVCSRIRDHVEGSKNTCKKTFTSVHVLEVPEDILNRRERDYIRQYKPIYNKRGC